jgi:predicted DNA binding protein
MYQATIHLQQEKSCVLTQLAREFGGPLDVSLEELHDHKVTFLLRAGDRLEAFEDRLAESDEVLNVAPLDDEFLVVTKHSCGAYAAIYQNHGILRRENQISARNRVYNIIFFDRSDLKSMVRDFREIGEVTLESLHELRHPTTTLTARQREVVEFALEMGYFEWPRRTSSEDLAAELGITRATCLEHLRKAEEKLLRQALDTLGDDGVPRSTRRPAARG